MAKILSTKSKVLKRKQIFSLSAPTAASVQLVGTFSEWQEHPIHMQKGTDGVWRTTIELGPGEHRYRFLVDGQWQDDIDCPSHLPNPFGSRDAVRRVS